MYMYRQKYLTYKNKYLQLMNYQIGGNTQCNLNSLTTTHNNIYNIDCSFLPPLNKTSLQQNNNNIQECYNLYKPIRLKMTEKYKKNIRSCPKLEDREYFEPYISKYIETLKKIPEDEDWWNKNTSCKTNEQKQTIDCFNKQLIKEFPEFKKGSCSKEALDNENKFMNEFNTNIIFKKSILNTKFNIYETNDAEYDKYIAVKPTKAKTTEIWMNYKIGTGEKTPKPKTDIVIKKDDTIIKKISLKSGSGRITSSDFYETSALFKSVYLSNYKDNDKLLKKIEYLFENFDKDKYKINDKNITFDKLKNIYKNKIYLDNTEYTKHIEWYIKKMNEYEILNKIWHELREEHSDFCMDIIKEAFQGKLKFDNNIGEADTLINLEGCTTNIVSVIDFNNIDEFNIYVKKMFESSVLKGNVFRTKSSSNDTKRILWTRFL